MERPDEWNREARGAEWDRLRAWARRVSIASGVMAGAGALIGLGTAFGAFAASNAGLPVEKEVGVAPVIWAAGFWAVAGLLWFGAQVLHLRAAAEWMAGKGPKSELAPPPKESMETIPRKTEANDYFLWVDEKSSGPHSAAQIRGMFSRSMVKGKTPCCRNGDEQWRTLEEFREIFEG